MRLPLDPESNPLPAPTPARAPSVAPTPAPAQTVAEVLDRMAAISSSLSAGDGVRAFNEMYLVTTQQVELAIVGATFGDPAFMGRLGVVFANLYLQALETHAADPSRVSGSWRALIEARSRRGVSQLQFATAGMNAHINFDLPRALVAVTREFGGGLDDHCPRHTDFVAINQVLARTQPIVKGHLLTGAFADLDGALGDRDDRVGIWAIERTREFAWTSAETLWTVRGTPLERTFTQAMDRMVSMTSVLLLSAAT